MNEMYLLIIIIFFIVMIYLIWIIQSKKVSKLKITNFPNDKKIHFKNVKVYNSFVFFINESENGNTIEKFEVNIFSSFLIFVIKFYNI